MRDKWGHHVRIDKRAALKPSAMATPRNMSEDEFLLVLQAAAQSPSKKLSDGLPTLLRRKTREMTPNKAGNASQKVGKIPLERPGIESKTPATTPAHSKGGFRNGSNASTATSAPSNRGTGPTRKRPVREGEPQVSALYETPTSVPAPRQTPSLAPPAVPNTWRGSQTVESLSTVWCGTPRFVTELPRASKAPKAVEISSGKKRSRKSLKLLKKKIYKVAVSVSKWFGIKKKKVKRFMSQLSSTGKN